MENARHIPKHFAIGNSEIVEIEKYGGGHINDTFLAISENGSEPARKFVFQRVNEHVFPDVPAVMENILRVTHHIHGHLTASGLEDADRRTLTVIPTNDGTPYHRDATGDFWRAYPFIENTTWVDVVSSPKQANAAALAFGQFARLLSDLPSPPLHITIPQFHDTPHRFQTLLEAIEKDHVNRAAGAKSEIEFALSCQPWHGVIADAQQSGAVPERIAHNDTKINNVLFDKASGEGICVIDLDTVMPGSALHDFGDLVRTAAATSAEDERDLSLVGVSLPVFEALAEGFLRSCGDVLTPTEIDLLSASGKIMSFEVGIRFLTDHLLGDTYFKVHYEGHNLHRAQTQFRLVQELMKHEEAMTSAVSALKNSTDH